MSDAPSSAWIPTPDGRRLYAERAGRGSPIVVFEAGMGGARTIWGAVAPVVATRTSTVVYDRSGLGRSPRDHGGRDLARLVDDLGAVLDHLGAGPFVLVGHSWGGPIVRRGAADRPERIAGLVLVDQTDEGCELFFTRANVWTARVARPIAPVAARLGVFRLAAKRLAAALPEPAASAMRAEDGTLTTIRAQQDEMHHYIDDLHRLRSAPPRPPVVPVTIISGTAASRLGRRRRAALVAAHGARATTLPHGRHVLARGSAHQVQLTEPDLVIAEVLRVVDLASRPARSGRPVRSRTPRNSAPIAPTAANAPPTASVIRLRPIWCTAAAVPLMAARAILTSSVTW